MTERAQEQTEGTTETLSGAAASRQSLEARVRQLENLSKNIPGGAHQCNNDTQLTLLSMSDSFLSMFGYSGEEIGELFGDCFINMVCPEDRAYLLKTVTEQLRTGSEIEAEYRVQRKNRPPVWVLDKGRLLDNGEGGTCFYCILIDISERRQAQEELRLSLERHQVIMNQTSDIIFEWDIRQDTLRFSSNWVKRFGYSPISEHISNEIPHSLNIWSEDIPAFVRIMEDTAAGIPYSETEFRIKNRAGQYMWCRIRATAQYDDYGHPIKAVGVIIDIDAEKRRQAALLEEAQHDALTGLYNKATINRLVEQRMVEERGEGNQALIIIDVDHFKKVNDTYGHLCGDGLLSDIASVLKNQIRASDLTGRIGGDEFLIYFAETADEETVWSKTERMLAALGVLTPEKGASPISCSAGVAVCRRNSVDFLTLYHWADQALYQQKKGRRGGVSLYNGALAEYSEGDGPLPTAVNENIGSDSSSVVNEQLPQYAFHTLYEAEDTKDALERLMEIIGRAYEVSRVYIFESSDDGLHASMTFEWCDEGVSPQKELLQHYSYLEDLGDYQSNFDDQELFCCRDIEETTPELRAVLEPQGIQSMLQCAMIDDGRFLGGVGFDECKKKRNWSRQEIATFKLTARVLATGLLRLRMKEKLKALGQ